MTEALEWSAGQQETHEQEPLSIVVIIRKASRTGLARNGYETPLFGGQHEARTPERCGHEHIHGGGVCGKIADEFARWLSKGDASDRPLFAQVNFMGV